MTSPDQLSDQLLDELLLQIKSFYNIDDDEKSKLVPLLSIIQIKNYVEAQLITDTAFFNQTIISYDSNNEFIITLYKKLRYQDLKKNITNIHKYIDEYSQRFNIDITKLFEMPNIADGSILRTLTSTNISAILDNILDTLKNSLASVPTKRNMINLYTHIKRIDPTNDRDQINAQIQLFETQVITDKSRLDYLISLLTTPSEVNQENIYEIIDLIKKIGFSSEQAHVIPIITNFIATNTTQNDNIKLLTELSNIINEYNTIYEDINTSNNAYITEQYSEDISTLNPEVRSIITIPATIIDGIPNDILQHQLLSISQANSQSDQSKLTDISTNLDTLINELRNNEALFNLGLTGGSINNILKGGATTSDKIKNMLNIQKYFIESRKNLVQLLKKCNAIRPEMLTPEIKEIQKSIIKKIETLTTFISKKESDINKIFDNIKFLKKEKSKNIDYKTKHTQLYNSLPKYIKDIIDDNTTLTEIQLIITTNSNSIRPRLAATRPISKKKQFKLDKDTSSDDEQIVKINKKEDSFVIKKTEPKFIYISKTNYLNFIINLSIYKITYITNFSIPLVKNQLILNNLSSGVATEPPATPAAETATAPVAAEPVATEPPATPAATPATAPVAEPAAAPVVSIINTNNIFYNNFVINLNDINNNKDMTKHKQFIYNIKSYFYLKDGLKKDKQNNDKLFKDIKNTDLTAFVKYIKDVYINKLENVYNIFRTDLILKILTIITNKEIFLVYCEKILNNLDSSNNINPHIDENIKLSIISNEALYNLFINIFFISINKTKLEKINITPNQYTKDTKIFDKIKIADQPTIDKLSDTESLFKINNLNQLFTSDIKQESGTIHDDTTNNRYIFILTLFKKFITYLKEIPPGSTLPRIDNIFDFKTNLHEYNKNDITSIDTLTWLYYFKVVIDILHELYSILYNPILYNRLDLIYEEYISKKKNIYSFIRIRNDITLRDDKTLFITNPRYKYIIDNSNKFLYLKYYNTDVKLHYSDLNSSPTNAEIQSDHIQRLELVNKPYTAIVGDKEYTYKPNKEYYYFGSFDKIFTHLSTNQNIADESKDYYIQKIDRAENICIIGYGQSGSGKTSVLVKLNLPTKPEDGIIIKLCNSQEFFTLVDSIEFSTTKLYINHTDTLNISNGPIKQKDYNLLNDSNYFWQPKEGYLKTKFKECSFYLLDVNASIYETDKNLAYTFTINDSSSSKIVDHFNINGTPELTSRIKEILQKLFDVSDITNIDKNNNETNIYKKKLIDPLKHDYILSNSINANINVFSAPPLNHRATPQEIKDISFPKIIFTKSNSKWMIEYTNLSNVNNNSIENNFKAYEGCIKIIDTLLPIVSEATNIFGYYIKIIDIIINKIKLDITQNNKIASDSIIDTLYEKLKTIQICYDTNKTALTILNQNYDYITKELNNCSPTKIEEYQQLSQFILDAFDDRQIEPTSNNPVSSRSHVIVNLKLTLTSKGVPSREGKTSCNITICDLAGVENMFDCENLNEILNFDKKYEENRMLGDKYSTENIDFDQYVCKLGVTTENIRELKIEYDALTKERDFLEQTIVSIPFNRIPLNIIETFKRENILGITQSGGQWGGTGSCSSTKIVDKKNIHNHILKADLIKQIKQTLEALLEIVEVKNQLIRNNDTYVAVTLLNKLNEYYTTLNSNIAAIFSKITNNTRTIQQKIIDLQLLLNVPGDPITETDCNRAREEINRIKGPSDIYDTSKNIIIFSTKECKDITLSEIESIGNKLTSLNNDINSRKDKLDEIFRKYLKATSDLNDTLIGYIITNNKFDKTDHFSLNYYDILTIDEVSSHSLPDLFDEKEIIYSINWLINKPSTIIGTNKGTPNLRLYNKDTQSDQYRSSDYYKLYTSIHDIYTKLKISISINMPTPLINLVDFNVSQIKNTLATDINYKPISVKLFINVFNEPNNWYEIHCDKENSLLQINTLSFSVKKESAPWNNLGGALFFGRQLTDIESSSPVNNVMNKIIKYICVYYYIIYTNNNPSDLLTKYIILIYILLNLGFNLTFKSNSSYKQSLTYKPIRHLLLEVLLYDLLAIVSAYVLIVDTSFQKIFTEQSPLISNFIKAKTQILSGATVDEFAGALVYITPNIFNYDNKTYYYNKEILTNVNIIKRYKEGTTARADKERLVLEKKQIEDLLDQHKLYVPNSLTLQKSLHTTLHDSLQQMASESITDSDIILQKLVKNNILLWTNYNQLFISKFTEEKIILDKFISDYNIFLTRLINFSIYCNDIDNTGFIISAIDDLDELLKNATVKSKLKQFNANIKKYTNNGSSNMSEDDTLKQKLSILVYDYIKYIKIEYNCKLRRHEGLMINKSLLELRNDIKKISIQNISNGADIIFFDKNIFPYCRNTNYYDDEIFDIFYPNPTETSTPTETSMYGTLISQILKLLGIEKDTTVKIDNFFIYTILNFTDSKSVNNPPKPPYVNINNLYYFNYICRNIQNLDIKYNDSEVTQEVTPEATSDITSKIKKGSYRKYLIKLIYNTFNELYKYEYYRINANITSEQEIFKKHIISNYTLQQQAEINFIQVDKELKSLSNRLCKLIQNVNASTLIGSIESTEFLQNMTFDKIPCYFDNVLYNKLYKKFSTTYKTFNIKALPYKFDLKQTKNPDQQINMSLDKPNDILTFNNNVFIKILDSKTDVDIIKKKSDLKKDKKEKKKKKRDEKSLSDEDVTKIDIIDTLKKDLKKKTTTDDKKIELKTNIKATGKVINPLAPKKQLPKEIDELQIFNGNKIDFTKFITNLITIQKLNRDSTKVYKKKMFKQLFEKDINGIKVSQTILKEISTYISRLFEQKFEIDGKWYQLNTIGGLFKQEPDTVYVDSIIQKIANLSAGRQPFHIETYCIERLIKIDGIQIYNKIIIIYVRILNNIYKKYHDTILRQNIIKIYTITDTIIDEKLLIYKNIIKDIITFLILINFIKIIKDISKNIIDFINILFNKMLKKTTNITNKPIIIRKNEYYKQITKKYFEKDFVYVNKLDYIEQLMKNSPPAATAAHSSPATTAAPSSPAATAAHSSAPANDFSNIIDSIQTIINTSNNAISGHIDITLITSINDIIKNFVKIYYLYLKNLPGVPPNDFIINLNGDTFP